MLRIITRSIRRKLAMIVLATAFAVLLVAGTILVFYDFREYREASFNDLFTQTEILGRASAPALEFADPKAATGNLALLKARPNIAAAAIYDAKGKLFASYTRRDLDLSFPKIPEVEGFRIEGRHFIVFKRIVENSEILGTAYMQADYEVSKRLLNYASIFSAVMVLSLFVGLMIYSWLQSVLTKPLLAIAEVTRKIVQTRDFSIRAQKTTQDEVGDLVDSFNDMLIELGRRSDALEATNQSLAREMSERRHADEELRRLNDELEQRVTERTAQLETANKELEAFSYSVSHDLRAPVRAIVGFSHILSERYDKEFDDEAKRILEIVESEARRMGNLIDDLLAFFKLGRQPMQKSEVDMMELVRSVCDRVKSQHDSTAADCRLAALPKAMGDHSLLGQVWTNLLSNAFKYSSKRTNPQIDVGAVSDEKEIIYFVRDNGAGFDPRYQSKLFGVFQRLHNASEFPGTGIGLALVERIVTRHGGRVWAEGKPDEGAAFYFTLPKE